MATRYFFIHCQKTAGTSLMFQLANIFSANEICPSEQIKKADGPMAILSLEKLKTYLKAGGSEIKIVSGHFPFCTKELLGPDYRTFTLLRDPVERTLSFLRHTRKMIPEFKDTSLEDIYDDEIRFHGLIHNHMVKMFSLPFSPDVDTVMTHVEFTEAHLTKARQNLNQVDVIGLQENYAEFCGALENKFGWTFEELLKHNTTEAKEAVRPQFIRRITQDNLLDIRFYKHAERLIEKRKALGQQV